MIVVFKCLNDECPALQEIKDENDGDFDDSDRHEWFGNYLPATRIDPGCYSNEECKHCGEQGEEVDRMTAKQLREEMAL